MAGNLIIPRVRVLWGGEDITFYRPAADWTPSKEPQPLVFDVSVSLQEEGQTPRGSMRWSPTGKAYIEYEQKFLKSKIKEPIQVQYYYVNGRSIIFQFIWAGHQITYGNVMDIQVSLGCELDGLFNGNTRSTAHAPEKGATFKAGNDKILQQFNVPKDILIYTPQADIDTSKNEFQHTYGEDITFFEKIQQLNQANGNAVMAANINSPGQCVIATPYSWEKTPPVAQPSDKQQDWPPNLRFGYFLGPSMINTMVRTAEWQKPQKNQSNVSAQTTRVQPAEINQYMKQAPESKPQLEHEGPGTKPTTSPQGTQRGKANPDTANSKNPDGPVKQDAMKKERGARIALNTMLVPALVGIKPMDILFIPNFKGDYIEDWIVTGVEYQQTDGGVDVSIQGARQYGLAKLMNPAVSSQWLPLAISLKLVGEGATLEKWEEYAWPPSLQGASSAPSSSPPGSPPSGPIPLEIVPYQGP